MQSYEFNRPVHFTVSIFVIDKQHLLLLKQPRSQFWLLPSGHIENTELPHEAAVREVREETGLDVVKSVFFDSFFSDGTMSGMDNLHFAFITSVTGVLGANAEIDEVLWFKTSEASGLKLSCQKDN